MPDRDDLADFNWPIVARIEAVPGITLAIDPILSRSQHCFAPPAWKGNVVLAGAFPGFAVGDGLIVDPDALICFFNGVTGNADDVLDERQRSLGTVSLVQKMELRLTDVRAELDQVIAGNARFPSHGLHQVKA